MVTRAPRWVGGLLRPLAGDEAGEMFWARHLRLGVAITESSAAMVSAYVVLADRPHRALLLTVAAVVMVGSPFLLRVPARMLSVGVRGPLIFYVWSLAVTAVVGIAAHLDGGSESPILWLLVLTIPLHGYPVLLQRAVRARLDRIRDHRPAS